MKFIFFSALFIICFIHTAVWMVSDSYEFFSVNLIFWQQFMSPDNTQKRGLWFLITALALFVSSAFFVKHPKDN